MAIDKITFVDYSEPAICAPWLNLVSDVIWDGLGQNTSPGAILNFIGGAPISHQHDHADTLNRDAVDAHPISSITDLELTLASVAVPPGGTTGQHLAKASDVDQDTEWVDAAGAGPHNNLTDRDAVDAHPISAITDLQTELDDLQAQLDAQWPVGSIYLTLGADDPNTHRPGTWVLTAEGRVLVGAGTLDTDTYAAGDEFGEARHALTANENGPHAHLVDYVAAGQTGTVQPRITQPNTQGTSYNTRSSGLGDPHENRPPSLAVNIWERTV